MNKHSFAAFKEEVALAQSEHLAKVEKMQVADKRRQEVIKAVAEALRLGVIDREQAVIRSLEWAGPLTCDELAEATGYSRAVDDDIKSFEKKNAIGWTYVERVDCGHSGDDYRFVKKQAWRLIRD